MTAVPERFTGKTVLVTGAGTGFGAEIAVRAAREGADVAIHYRSSSAGAEATAERVTALGRKAFIVQADIAERAQIRRLADEVWARFGRLDVAVNNVGDVAREQMSWRDITEESIDHVLAVDVKGTLLCTHEFGARMLEQEGAGPSSTSAPPWSYGAAPGPRSTPPPSTASSASPSRTPMRSRRRFG